MKPKPDPPEEPALDDRLIEQFGGNVERASRVADKALERAARLLDEGKEKEANWSSSVARNAAVVSGISVDKRQLLSGLPTMISAQLPAAEALSSLANLLGVSVDSTATEITQGELPPAA